MAEIPIQHKSGKGWLWALLALLLVALLAWWLLDNDGNDVVEYTDSETVAAAPTETGAMSSDATGAEQLAIGQSVDLRNIRVTSLAGDMAFNADVNGRNMLVVFDEQPTPGTPTEGRYDINQGSTVNLKGSVRSAADSLPEGVTAQIPAEIESYIYAESIEMVS